MDGHFHDARRVRQVGKQSRERSRERRLAQAAAERRGRIRRRLFAVGGVVILGLVAAIVVSAVRAADDAGEGPAAAAASAGPVVVPSSGTAAGAIVTGQANAPVTVVVYLDYLCPYCGRFEKANSAELERLIAAGTMRLELHPLAFLDRLSAGTRYSTRSANAIATVADAAPGRVLAFNRALYEQQPAEGGPGLTDDELAAVAASVGVDAAVTARFRHATFESWVTAATAAAVDDGVSGTPTVRINGKAFTGDLYTAGALTRAVESAAGRS
jgi:protein-disulfide isomerase